MTFKKYLLSFSFILLLGIVGYTQTSWRNKIDIFYKKSQFGKALLFIDSSLSINRTPELLVEKAYCRKRFEEWSDAKAKHFVLEQSIELTNEIKGYLNEALSINPNYGPAYYAKYKLTFGASSSDNLNERIDLLTKSINKTKAGEIKALYIFEKANEILYWVGLGHYKDENDMSFEFNDRQARVVKNAFYEVKEAIGMTQEKDNKSYWHRRMAETYYYRLSDAPSALQSLSEGILKNPNDYKSYVMRAEIQMDLENYSSALSDYLKVPENKRNADTYTNIGLCYSNKNQFTLAIASFAKAIALRESKIRNAKSSYETTLEKPALAKDYYNRAYCYKKLKNKIKMCADLANAGNFGSETALEAQKDLCK